jgi:hypothetical protein
MEALTLQVFVSLVLAAGGVLLFLFSGKWRDVEHADRLALFPMETEETTPHRPGADAAREAANLPSAKPTDRTTPPN